MNAGHVFTMLGVGMHEAEVARVFLNAAGLFHAGFEVERERLSPADREAFDEDCARGEALETWCAENLQPEPPPPMFRTIEACMRYVTAHAALSFLAVEMQAFNAPSECCDLASPSLVAELEAAEAEAV